MASTSMRTVLQHLRSAVLLQDGAGMTDAQLLQSFVTHRDQAAFAALVRRHAPMVWGVCRRGLHNYQDAEDAFQATFLILVRKAVSIASPELLANWLYGAAYNTALKARAKADRRRTRERQVTEMPEPAVVDQDLWRDLRPLLDRELSRLPDIYRVVIVLCDLEGKTRKEAARQLGVPEGTVAGRLARARGMLAKRLARHGLAVSAGTLAALLAQNATSVAGVPTLVVSSTIKTASLLAAGKAAMISSHVASLTEEVLKVTFLIKLKTTALSLLTLCALTSVTGVALWHSPFGRPTDAGQTSALQAARQDHTSDDNPANGPLANVPADDTEVIVGSGEPGTKLIDVANFTALDVSAASHIEVTKADTFGVSVTADDNLLEHLQVNKHDATLRIRVVDGQKIRMKNPFRVTITMPAVKGVTLGGACRATLQGFEANDHLEIKLTGTSTLDGTIRAKNLQAKAEGNSEVTLTGSATQATLSASSASRILLADLALDSAKVHLTGESQAEINTKSKLDYALSGSSRLKYLGKPAIGRKETSGHSSAQGQ
jgi:RNA polymerase sigma factor (sigma-70 family)